MCDGTLSWFGFHQKRTLKQGSECRHFTWEMTEGRGRGRMRQRRERSSGGFVTTLETTVGTGNHPLGNSGKPCRTHASELAQLRREGSGN